MAWNARTTSSRVRISSIFGANFASWTSRRICSFRTLYRKTKKPIAAATPSNSSPSRTRALNGFGRENRSLVEVGEDAEGCDGGVEVFLLVPLISDFESWVQASFKTLPVCLSPLEIAESGCGGREGASVGRGEFEDDCFIVACSDRFESAFFDAGFLGAAFPDSAR